MSVPTKVEFDKQRLVLHELPIATQLYRIYKPGGRDPLAANWGFHGRWSCPSSLTHDNDKVGERFGVLYLGLSYESAFLETCGRKASTPQRYYSPDTDRLRNLCIATNQKTVRLADLTAHGLSLAGLTKGTAGSEDYPTTQHWAWLLWGHPEKVDGILYRCKGNEAMVCAALFDRVDTGLKGNLLEAQSGGLLGKDYLSQYQACVSKYELVALPN